jgi:hypothetical protein
MHTPFFPAWRSRLAPLGSRTAKRCRQVRAYTLCQLETCFGSRIPSSLFPKAARRQNSRDRDYTRWRTFWCMLWQAFNPRAPGREVVRQLQALFDLEGGPQLSPDDGAYCRAKKRLPLAQFAKALSATASQADRLCAPVALLGGRPIKVADGSTFIMPDTAANRTRFPPHECGQTPGFPQARFVVLFSLLSGAILAVAQGAFDVSELGLLHCLAGQLVRADILLADRGFGNYPMIAWLQSLGVDFVGRSTRRVDGRKRWQRLGRNDWLMRWTKSSSSFAPWLTQRQRKALPSHMILRAVRGSCFQKGFRVRRLTVLTTLLDPQRYPAAQILQAYLRRWRLEMCLDDLKSTLCADFLRGRTPQMIRKELYTRLIAHNLVRCMMAQAAAQAGVPLERISFKGSLDSLRHFSHAMARARCRAHRRRLWHRLLETLGGDLVPLRPGRREPRALKRKKNKYPRLNAPRHRFRDHPKRTTRRKNARLRRLSLM